MLKIGYPCINRSLDCTFSTFRLKSYSEEKLSETVQKNLIHLQRILSYNQANGFYFFRISSDMVPFASHPICQYAWTRHFKKSLCEIGAYIKRHAMRISMHPSQFVIINSSSASILENSIHELAYHAALLDALELDNTAKIQIHVGGVYGDKATAIARFIENYAVLPPTIKKRLVIENDDRSFTLADCLQIHAATGIPIIFDNLHHECLHRGESLVAALAQAQKTWRAEDGVMMVDYSSQAEIGPKGKHTESIDAVHFSRYLNSISAFDCDIMLEIKDKEASALRALAVVRKQHPHLIAAHSL